MDHGWKAAVLVGMVGWMACQVPGGLGGGVDPNRLD